MRNLVQEENEKQISTRARVMRRMTSFADKYTEKFISRPFLVMMIATHLTYTDKLSSEDFVAIAMVFIGIQRLADIAIQWKHGLKN
jgi:hypothetical protein